MDQIQIAKQMMEFNKMTFDNTFKSMVFFRDQTEKLFIHCLDKAVWFPEDGKKVFSEWLNTYKKGMAGFKVWDDENYKKIDDYFAESMKEETQKDGNKS